MAIRLTVNGVAALTPYVRTDADGVTLITLRADPGLDTALRPVTLPDNPRTTVRQASAPATIRPLSNLVTHFPAEICDDRSHAVADRRCR